MTFQISPKPVEKILFASDALVLGIFRCDSSNDLFADSGPCNGNVIVFPRRVVAITHSDGTSFVGDPTTITLYNFGQRYKRRAVSRADHSDWIALSDDFQREIREWSHSTIELGRPFKVPFVPAPPPLYVEQRLLFESLMFDAEADRAATEEKALAVVSAALAPLARWRDEPVRGAQRKICAAKEMIATRLARNVPLGEIASSVGVTPFRLCRLFKAATGSTLTGFRTDLRLRSALQLLGRPGADILEVATNLGFSSHSHFSARFAQRFGITPSQFRARVRPARVQS